MSLVEAYPLGPLAEWPRDVLTLAVQTDFLGFFKLEKATVPPWPATSHPSVIISLLSSLPSHQWWGVDWGFGFATSGSLIGKVSANSVRNTHIHTLTHTHTRSLPRSVTTVTGNPHHCGFLPHSGLGILYLRAWILHS